MEDSSSPETQSPSDTQQDHLFRGVDGVTRILMPASMWLRVPRESPEPSVDYAEIDMDSEAEDRETRQSSESYEGEVGSQAEEEESLQSSENSVEIVVSSPAEGGEARPLEVQCLPNPSPTIFDDDTMVKRSCYEDCRLEYIEDSLIPVSASESDHCAICQEKYNTILDIPTMAKDIAYCDECQRSFAIKPDTGNSHKACALQECSHVFGRYCITQWLMENSTCPLCRNDVDIQWRNLIYGGLQAGQNMNYSEGSPLTEIDQ